MIVGQDWGGPQGVGAALQRVERLDALVLMNTWLFTDYIGKFHQSPLPWTTWHAPLIGQLLMKRFKLLSHHGVSAITRRTMTEDEKRAYHHVFDEPDSDHVVLTWPRTIPLREGDRGWSDMQMIQRRLPELARVPTLLLWAPEDTTFTIQYANRLKELLPHAEGPILFDRARHFLQDDRGPDLAAAIIPFLKRTLEQKYEIRHANGRGIVLPSRRSTPMGAGTGCPAQGGGVRRTRGWQAGRPIILALRSRPSVCARAGRPGSRAAIDGDGLWHVGPLRAAPS